MEFQKVENSLCLNKNTQNGLEYLISGENFEKVKDMENVEVEYLLNDLMINVVKDIKKNHPDQISSNYKINFNELNQEQLDEIKLGINQFKVTYGQIYDEFLKIDSLKPRNYFSDIPQDIEIVPQYTKIKSSIKESNEFNKEVEEVNNKIKTFYHSNPEILEHKPYLYFIRNLENSINK